MRSYSQSFKSLALMIGGLVNSMFAYPGSENILRQYLSIFSSFETGSSSHLISSGISEFLVAAASDFSIDLAVRTQF